MQQTPTAKGTQFSILNAVSSDNDDSCSSDDSDGEAAMSDTPDDVVYSGSEPTFIPFVAQKSADCKPAVRFQTANEGSTSSATESRKFEKQAGTSIDGSSSIARELQDAASDQKLFLKQWHYQQRQQLLKDKPVRFPQLKKLLDALFGVSDLARFQESVRSDLRNRRLGKSQFSSELPRRQNRPKIVRPETQSEKQLRKAVECFQDENYFKAICCYSKVSFLSNLLGRWSICQLNARNLISSRINFIIQDKFNREQVGRVFFSRKRQTSTLIYFQLMALPRIIYLHLLFSQACQELQESRLTLELKADQPHVFDSVADLNLCSSICYIKMRQYSQAKDALEQILAIEHAQTEAIIILCWSFTSNLILEHNKRNFGKFAGSDDSEGFKQELSMA